MPKQGRLFNAGIILLWAENGLNAISLAVERKTQKLLKKWHKKDRQKQRVNKQHKERKKEHQILAKEQDYKLEYTKEIEQRSENDQTLERLSQLQEINNEASQDAELDKD